jgi:hypothetical protein
MTVVRVDHITCPHCGRTIAMSGLSLEAQNTEVLKETAHNVAEALRSGNLVGTDIVNAWDYLLRIEAELERRHEVPTLEEAIRDAEVQDR